MNQLLKKILGLLLLLSFVTTQPIFAYKDNKYSPCCPSPKKKKRSKKADYIIVGFGTAGSVAARYLSDPVHGKYKNSVLVLEAGQNRSQDPEVLAGPFTSNAAELAFNSKYAVTKSCPDQNPLLGFYANEVYGSGRMWFGSAAHNFMLAVRGSSDVWDDLVAATGNTQWSYNNMLPYFKFVESFFGDTTQPNDRGEKGPLAISQIPHPLFLDQFATNVAIALNTPILPDYNVPDGNNCVTNAQLYCSSDFSERSFGLNFLPPTLLSPEGKGLNGRKLRVRSGAFVNRVLFKGNKAIGVEYFLESDPTPHIAYADKQVILCAGCPFSASILQRSGVGPSSVLSDPFINVPVLVDNPLVGTGMKEHYGILYAMTQPEDPNLQVQVQFLTFTDGGNFFEPAGTGDGKRRFEMTWSGGQSALPGGLLSPLGLAPFQDGLVSFVHWYLRPRSTGTAFIVDNNPFTMPDIRLNLYSDGDLSDPASDLSASVALFNMTKAVADQVGSIMVYPEENHFADPNQLAFDAGGCLSFSPLTVTNHYSGTCNMGTNISNGVVSGTDLHVFGTRHLMVADSSCYPFPMTGNTAMQNFVMGLKAATILGYQLPE